MSTEPDADDAVMRPFADWLLELRKGEAHQELTRRLHELILAIDATGKPGSLTLTVSVQPLKDTGSAVKVTDTVKTKLPEFARQASIFFSDAGNLHRNNPNQLTFESLRDVSDADPREPDARERQAGRDA